LTSPVVHIVGAGPGDPGLLTLRGRDLLSQADLVVYAGSLVNPGVLRFARQGCRLLNSHGLTLAEIVDAMAEEAVKGRVVVRLASGDPSLYGSIQEMKEELEKRGVGVEVVPGVSSLAAAASALTLEYTQPGGVQSLVVTRLPGRTPVRPQESLERFAATGASIALFLSVDKAEEIRARCLRGGQSPHTPVAVVHKASWAEQGTWWTTLDELPRLVEREGLKGSALVLLLPNHGEAGARSHLYGGEPSLEVEISPDPIAIIPVTIGATRGLVGQLEGIFPNARVLTEGRLAERVEKAWELGIPLLIVGPVGVAVRVAAPLLRGKALDPPVVVVDIAGSFAVALSGGHHGANSLAHRVARGVGAVPVITTGTQVLGRVSLEELAGERGFTIHPETDALLFNKAMIEGGEVFSLGMGWRKGASKAEVEEAFNLFVKNVQLGNNPAVLATGETKAQEAEKVLLPLARRLGAAMVVVPNSVLNAFPGPTKSMAEEKLGVVGVAEPSALAVLPHGELVVTKQVIGNVTLALARGNLGGGEP